MIKQTIYTNPDDGSVWCVTVERGAEFTATYNPDEIAQSLTPEWREAIKDASGENIAVIRVSEAES